MVPILKQSKLTSSLQISHANKIIRIRSNNVFPVNYVFDKSEYKMM